MSSPALLDPLQSHGRILKPCLVHGDLWEENAGVNIDTQQPVVFDLSCMYAHNEYDLGMWRREVIRFGQPYFRQYLMRMPPSEPASQWDDRNRLYSIKEDVYKDMGILINKYGPRHETNGPSAT
ncbi:Protein-ribulosamine 3-kinase like protein [Verticillium longisporum]|nr:Protein-ribulosamine 3-kinase like protein [Verticillium longisporum]